MYNGNVPIEESAANTFKLGVCFVVGKLSITLFGKNKATKRDSLCAKWRLNRGNFQYLVGK